MTTPTNPERTARDASLHDDAVEQLLGNLLRWGVLVAGAIVALGGALFLSRHGMERPDYHVFRGEPPDLTSVRGILAGALALDPRAVVQLGVLALIATPILRVAFSLVAFLLQRDRLYVLITSIVLALLAFSLLGGHAAH